MDRGEWEGGRRRGTLIARAPEMTSPVRRTLSSVTSALAVRNLWMYLERKDCRAGTVADAEFTAFYSWRVNGAVALGLCRDGKPMGEVAIRREEEWGAAHWPDGRERTTA